VVITSRGKPRARLVPVEVVPERGSVAAILAAVRQFKPHGLTHDEIETVIEAERNGWE
jgi:antitoxin (DNA-binding transcriptional repressor) of toxin-antitoxin stability system